MGPETGRFMVPLAAMLASPAVAFVVAARMSAFEPGPDARPGTRPVALALLAALLTALATLLSWLLLPAALAVMTVAVALAFHENRAPSNQEEDLMQLMLAAKLAAERGEASRAALMLQTAVEDLAAQAYRGPILPGLLRRRA